MKKYIIPLLFLLLLSGCSSKAAAKDIKTLSDIKQPNNEASVKSTNKQTDSNYNLTSLNIVLPANWNLDTSDKVQYKFADEKGKTRGWVSSMKYEEDFDFSKVKPNHSSIINDEYIDIPLGKCRLVTLDADNGTAASGITGTHNDYYAIISLKDKIIYVLEFSQNDKKPQTKEQFKEILNNLSFK